MTKEIYVALLLILLPSCVMQKKENREEFKREISLTNYTVIPNLELNPPAKIVASQDELLFIRPNFDNLLCCISLQNGATPQTFGHIGQGPDELISPMLCSYSEKNKVLYLFDPNLQMVKGYTTGQGEFTKIFEKKFSHQSVSMTNLHQLTNGYFVASVLSGEQFPIILLDPQLHIIDNTGAIESYPSTISSMISYRGIFSSIGDNLIFCMEEMGYLAYYRFNNGKINKLWDYYFQQPHYDKLGCLDRTKLSNGFYDVKMTPNYIFCAYSGKNVKMNSADPADFLPETILVFDHQGTPVVKFITKIPFGRFDISPDGQKIFVSAASPEVEITFYDISSYL